MTDKTTPAFPVYGNGKEGLTMRDYFAAKAMQGMLANPDMPDPFVAEAVASYCYKIADTMMEARK